MGIVVDVTLQTFSIESEKLNEIYDKCLSTFISTTITRRELQSLLGKLLYISRCVRGARIFLNRILQVYRDNHGSYKISLTDDCIPERKSGILRIQYGHAAAAAEISFWTR